MDNDNLQLPKTCEVRTQRVWTKVQLEPADDKDDNVDNKTTPVLPAGNLAAARGWARCAPQ